MEINRESIISPETGTRLASLFHSYHAPARRTYSAHRHTSFEIAIFKKGRGIYCCNNKLLDFQAGDIFIFSTNEEHFISEISEEMLVMNLHFEPQYIYSFVQLCEDNSVLRIFFDRSDRFCNRLPREHAVTKQLVRCFEELENEFFNRPDNYEMMIKIKILSMLVLMTRELGYVNAVSKKGTPQTKCSDELMKVMDYINCNFESDISLEKLSHVGHMSPNYLCAVFKQMNGMTIWEYILIRRIDEAKRLLRSSNESILSIQFSCGYRSSSNFNKAFKRLVGMSPSEYRAHIKPMSNNPASKKFDELS